MKIWRLCLFKAPFSLVKNYFFNERARKAKSIALIVQFERFSTSNANIKNGLLFNIFLFISKKSLSVSYRFFFLCNITLNFFFTLLYSLTPRLVQLQTAGNFVQRGSC